MNHVLNLVMPFISTGMVAATFCWIRAQERKS